MLGISAQLSKIADPTLLMPSNVAIEPADSAYLGVIFDSNLSMSHHFSSVSKSCFSYIRYLRRIKNTRPYSCPHYCHISHSLETRLLQLSVFKSSPVSTRSPPTHSKLFSSSVVRHSKFFAHHSSSQILLDIIQ